MKEKYKKWIEKNVTNPYGACDEIAQKMELAFPELKRVRGHYHCDVWGERAHWWLVDQDGGIIDPTAKQFPSGGCSTYKPWEEGENEPTGKCLNCGNYCYNGKSTCSKACMKILDQQYSV